MTEKEKLQELLEKLVQAIFSAIGEGLAEKTLQPHYMRCIRWRVTEFEYGDTGIKKLSRQGDEFLKPFWATNEVFQKVIKLDIYGDTYKAVSEDYGLGEGKVNEYLYQLITGLAKEYLAGKMKTLADATKYIDSFLKDLHDEKQEYRAEVQLKGLILQPDLIQLDGNTRLRKPIREDFEREVLGGLSYEQVEVEPTAFLNTSIYANESNAIRHEIDEKIAILRLFRIGSVQDIRYNLDTDSIVKLAPSGGWSGKLIGPDKYLITNEEVEPLKVFWSNMKDVKLPDSAYPHRPQVKQDELSIAYDRYNDSLETHILEKRISSAVMGLEALYLSPSERQELTFKLSMRVGKLLSQIGYSAEKVRKELTHAYDIRSTYVHGKTLTQKQKNRHEKEVGELGQFSKVVMDYLRASIVAWLERPSKTSLIQKIDDSFLDSKKEEEIKKLLFMPY